jgi:protein-tyrosine phosphatase
MNQVEPNLLWIGHAGEGRDYRLIFDSGIEALVQLAAEEMPPQPPREIVCCHFPLLDGTGNKSTLLVLAIRTVTALLQIRWPTAVTCATGMSRAPAIAAAALSLAHGKPIEECLQQVVACHPSDVSAGFWSEVVSVVSSLR